MTQSPGRQCAVSVGGVTGPLAGVSTLLAAVICWPLFGGYLLHRDAVATPRSPLTAAAFGLDGAAPRAVPQDGFLALVSPVVDGGFLVAAILFLTLLAAGIGYGRLAARLLPSTGTAGAVAAAIVAIWNPFVAERLLQGHWSLLTGYAALGWLVPAVLRLGPGAGVAPWAGVAGLFAVAGLTPTGSVLGLLIALVTVAGLPGHRLPTLAGLVPVWIVTALPWLVAAAVSDGAADGVGGGQAFAARAEPGLGTFGSLLGLGGIWNAEAVPASRAYWWAAVATGCLLLVVAGGCAVLWRRRETVPPTVTVLAVLAVVTLVAVAAAGTGAGLEMVDTLLARVPGAGLLRDTQKYLALAVPFVAVAVAAAAGWLRTWVPTGFAVAVIALLVIAPLPDLAWGAGGKVRPVQYPDDYAAVTDLIGSDDTAVAVWPATPMRHYRWNHGPSLSPLPRMLDAPVLLGGELTVDDQTLDRPAGRTGQVSEVLDRGGAPEELARLGVGWVVVEADGAPQQLAAQVPPVFQGADLTVYRIDGAQSPPAPGSGAWVAAGVAHGLWLLCLLAGPVAQLTSRRTRSKPAPAAGQE
ncbi:hypothetical protein GOHSU_47_00190 [Gordonia hirsuta DSM 44140 = NBRC 16056]|uniref:Transmembrane protein n=1 Tax=Gordonia hirsuta DSM 44140 = NBRC 16056 TaxID=1121927 RepID=L7LF97_9ACTN|nr:hypothetical protein [Gordonia hirsuta]GAC58733.1 hypothetical protein GOHSU_47_00190 [Gordonia hirsuta DSM 44140 = NBRC 16056]